MRKILFCLAFLAGCASTPAPQTTGSAAANANQEVICITERQVGSHFSRRVCRTKAEMDRAKREAEELIERTREHESAGTPTE